MADVTTSNEELVIDYLFVDEDTRVQKLKNPKADITKEEISDLNAWLQANNVVIGDRNGAVLARIKTVTRRETTKTELDLKVS